MTPKKKKIEEALMILVKQLESAGVRKFTCMNQSGFSLVERDIVDSQKKYWQKGMYSEEEVKELFIKFVIENTNISLIVAGNWLSKNKKK